MSNKYKITAWILCHDLKFNEYVSTVEAEKEPAEQEVWTLLEPATDKVLEKYKGAGEPYELNSTAITKL